MEEDKKIKEASIEDGEVSKQKKDQTEEEKEMNPRDKKVRSLIALVIFLGGLFLGSLFVDVAQLVKGEGVSKKVISDKDVFELDGKTWVAYGEPMVEVSVVNDDECENCDVSEAMVWLRRVTPTIVPKKVDYASEEGKAIAEKFGVKSVPAFIFSKKITETDFYSQAQVLFSEKDGQYVLNTAQLGIPAGKYLATPSLNEDAVKIGLADAKVKMIVFSDFQCPYSKLFNSTVEQVLKEYRDKVLYSFKNLPLDSIHPRARAAAQAVECANEQGKFLEYSNKLFEKQSDWGKTEGNQIFKTYAAQLGLKAEEFGKCVDEEKYKDKVENDAIEAESFGISGTPGIFINDQFRGGAIDFETVKKIIDEELGGVGENSQEAPKTEE